MSPATGPAAETIRMLYPDPWTITTGRARDGRQRRSFLLMPNRSGARVIVPAGPPRALAAAMRRHSPGGRASARVRRHGLAALCASGLVGMGWPYRLDVAGQSGADSLERWLERRLGLGPCLLAIRLGPPRANRKPVVQVLDPAGAVRAYVKVGHNALSTSLVSTEAGVLAHLERAGLHRVRVPRVLAHDEWNGLRLLALEPLPVSATAASPDDVRDAADQIAGSSERVSMSWRGSSFRGRLVTQIASSGTRLAALDDVVAGLDRTDPVIEFGAWHGDFNPGNFGAGPDGLLVWDWERYDHEVPVGFDVLHLAMQHNITVAGRDPRDAATDLLAGAAALLARATVPEPGLTPEGNAAAHENRATGAEIARLYLAWLACRYVRDGQDRAGARLGSVEQWVLPALAGAR